MARLVRVNALGLVIPPQRLDCLGETCPVYQKIGRCFVDEHHLYFPYRKFVATELGEKFRAHPFNRVKLPRCQHNSRWTGSIHKSKDEAPIPSREIMERFLNEADLLQELGVLAVKSDGLLGSLNQAGLTRSVQKRRQAEFEETQASLQGTIEVVRSECEIVLPFLSRLPENTLRHFGGLALSLAA
jgi:hypothetical protein